MTQFRGMAGGRTHGLDTTLSAIGFVLWFSFILFCVGLNQSHGLWCADDAGYAIIAKSLVSGLGYATTFDYSGDPAHPVLFNPWTGTGPTLIIPCAIAFKIFGKNDVLPGLTAILIWGGVLTFVLARISRRIDGLSFLLGVSVMCAAILASFPLHFAQWYAFLGEIVAAAFLILGHWIISNERFSEKWSFLCGLTIGCAFQAKFLAATAVTGIALVFFVRGVRAGFEPLRYVKHAAAMLIGFLIPTLAFEAYKLFELGAHAYLTNSKELLHAVKKQGGQSNTHVTLLLLKQRIALVHAQFGVSPIGLLAFTAFAVLLYWRSASKNWISLSAGLLLSVATSAVYWATVSIGWPRYLVIAVAMAAFLLSVPVFTLEVRPKLVFALVTLVLLRNGFSRVGQIVESADHGLFKPTTERAARASLMRVIGQRRQEAPAILASLWWASFADVEFSLPGSMNFKRIEPVIDLPQPKIILLNHRFDPIAKQDELINKVRTRTSAIIFRGGPYELLEVR